jgi:hypothetical protein
MVAVDVARELRDVIDGEVFFDLGSIGAGKPLWTERLKPSRRC